MGFDVVTDPVDKVKRRFPNGNITTGMTGSVQVIYVALEGLRIHINQSPNGLWNSSLHIATDFHDYEPIAVVLHSGTLDACIDQLKAKTKKHVYNLSAVQLEPWGNTSPCERCPYTYRSPSCTYHGEPIGEEDVCNKTPEDCKARFGDEWVIKFGGWLGDEKAD